MPEVSPQVLVWARETAGLDLHQAATKIRLREARGRTPAERLIDLEAGRSAPTRAQLARMAEVYRRPLVAFYLPTPPRQGERGTDFRTQTGEIPADQSAWLDALIRAIRTRHGLLRAALEEEEDLGPVEFIGRLDPRTPVSEAADRARALLRFDRSEFRRQRTLREAFSYLRTRVEEAGVFVLLIGDLGSHHTAISADTFRGYALADPVAPMIVVNDRDARGAWSFTLLHEFCHLMLGASGVSGDLHSDAVERLCNDVASALLLDSSELLEIDVSIDLDPLAAAVRGFARTRKLSRTMVAYRLLRSGRIDARRWHELASVFRDEWLQHRERQRSMARDAEGGPTYYVVRRHRIGDHLLGTVDYLLRTGHISLSKAAKVLGVRPTNVYQTLAPPGA